MIPDIVTHMTPRPPGRFRNTEAENQLLRQEIRFARESAEITAELVVKQFEETERVLRRFQEANALRKAVLDAAIQFAIIATDSRGMITVFNKGAERMLGYTAKEVIGVQSPAVFHLWEELKHRAEDMDHPVEEKEINGSFFLKCARRNVSKQTEWTYVRKDGEVLPVVMSINELEGTNGMLGGVLCIATDVTEKKRSEQALKESEANYRLLVNSIPNIVFKGYADGTIDFFDDKIEALTGYPRKDFLSRKLNWFDLVLEEDRPRLTQTFQEALHTDGAYTREYRIRKKNGETVWIEAGSRIIRDEKGRIQFITGAFQDISKRKKAEQAVQDSEEKYRSLFDSGPNPIFVLDRHTHEILDANPSAEDIYGIPGENLVGKSFMSLGVLESEDSTLDHFKNGDWANACVESERVRHRIKGRDDALFVRMKTCAIRYREREAVILAITDITDSVEKDAQLFQAGKMATLGELSAGIAHELNQPLNAIKIGNAFLKRMVDQGKTPPLDAIREVASAVSGQVDRAGNIINLLRAFGRKPDFEKAPVYVNVPVRNVLGIIGRQLTLENIDVVLELDDAIPPILANANRLEQVVFNLVTNARDAIEVKAAHMQTASFSRTITVRSFFSMGRVGISIGDTGIGISPDKKEKIYEPFFTTKEIGKGVGLGLSIIYGIIQDLNGTIEVESQPMAGTTFFLKFPPFGA